MSTPLRCHSPVYAFSSAGVRPHGAPPPSVFARSAMSPPLRSDQRGEAGVSFAGMIADAPPVPAAHSVRMSRSSVSSTNGDVTPMHTTGVSGDGYDSDGSNFTPPTPTTLPMSILAELAGAIPLIDRFQFEVFLRSMQKQIQSAGKHGFFSNRSVGPQVREKFTLKDMLCFQKDPIPSSLLKLSGDLVTRSVKSFQIILKYMGIDSSDKLTPFNLEEGVELVAKLYKHTLKRSETSG